MHTYNIAISILLAMSQKMAMLLAGAILHATGPAGVHSLNFCDLENKFLVGFQSPHSQLLIYFENYNKGSFSGLFSWYKTEISANFRQIS